MGRDKAFIDIGGRPLVRTVAAALTGAGASHLFTVGGDTSALEAAGLEVVADRHPGEGPLGGLLTAFAAARTDVVVVLACDLPGADAGAVTAVLDTLLASPAAAVAWPEVGGRRHVLHAAWRTSMARAVLAAAFDRGERSPRRAAAGLPHVVVTTIPSACLHNANRPEDLDGR